MKGMFDRKVIDPKAIRTLKAVFLQKFPLQDNTSISIAELSCHEPDCPPIETVITVRYENGSMKNWRVAKPISEVEETDIYELEEHSH